MRHSARMDAQYKIAVGLAEAAQRISVGTRYVQYLVQSGALPSVKIGRRRLIRVRDLERYLSTDRPSPQKHAQVAQ